MEVRAGYKQTVVGVIPEDWAVEDIAACAESASGTTPARAAAERYFHGGTIPWVKTLDLNNSVIKETDECVTETALRETSLKLYPAGSVLVAMYGGFAQIGRTGYLPFPATINQALTAICPNDRKLDSKYLIYFLNHHVGYWKSVASSSRKDPNITGNDVRKFPISLPPTKEQRAIATALSNADALLDGLTRLIAKKRDLKQATMQQLLTGQTRLPGFSDEWVESRLRDVIEEIGDGGTPATSNPRNFGGAINWVVIEDIKDEISATALKLTEQGLKSCTAKLWPPDTLIVSTGATIGEVGIARVPLATKQGICGVVVDKSKAIPDYLKYWFRLNKPLLLAKAQGSTIKEIRAPTLVQLELRVPSVTEQDAIVSVLSTMDAELSALEARLTKTRALKQAMMYELLTGKTRLPT